MGSPESASRYLHGGELSLEMDGMGERDAGEQWNWECSYGGSRLRRVGGM